MHRKLTFAVAALLIAGSLTVATPNAATAQSSPTVSMVTLQTQPGQNGKQMVVLPRGAVVPLPGNGVNANQVQIYMGSQGGYWYTDRNGQNVDLTSAVQYLRQRQAQQAQNVPQYAPQPVTNNYYENGNSNSGSGSGSGSSSSSGSGLGTAVAAGLGAATGAALTNAIMEPNNYYRGVPYGTPVYYGNGGAHYYGANNKPVYVNNSKDVNRNTNINAKQNNVQVNNLQKQQDWYSKQATNNSNQFKNWQKSSGGDNPFVHQNSQNTWKNGDGNFTNRNGGNGNFADRNGGNNNFGNRNGGNGNFGDRNGGNFGGGNGTVGSGGLEQRRDSGSGGGFMNREGSSGGGLLGGRSGGGGGFRGRRR